MTGLAVRRVPAARVAARAGQLGRLAAAAIGDPAAAAYAAAEIGWAAASFPVRCAVAACGPDLAGFALSYPRPPLPAWAPAGTAEMLTLAGAVAPEGTRLLAAIFVLPRWQRHGAGTRLLGVACPPGQPVVLTVAADSPARGFYRQAGFGEALVFTLPDGRAAAVKTRDR